MPAFELNDEFPKKRHKGEDHIIRLECSYQSNDQRFTLQKRQFKQQYSHIYARRLTQLRGGAEREADRLWGKTSAKKCARLVEAHAEEDDKLRICVGTLFKTMSLRPSVLAEYRDERGISETIGIPHGHFTSNDDTLLLEDDSGRLNLVPSTTSSNVIPVQELPTGIVIAVLGIIQQNGDMAVKDWCTPGIPLQPMPPKGYELTENRDACIMLVSGLMAGGSHDLIPTRLLLDHLAGYMGDEEERNQVASIVRVVICGNCADSRMELSSTINGKMTLDQGMRIAAPVKECDAEIALMVAALPVDVMPGESDPSNYMLPQQPLHPCLFPLAERYNTLNLVTNPHQAWVGGRLILGTSGQPLENILQYTEESLDSVDKLNIGNKSWRLRVLENMLCWRHLSPTSPDTLGCYPCLIEDPFVIDDCPHIFFAGNQPKFETSVLEGQDGQKVRVICVPSFSSTGEVVLVNLFTLETTVLQFGISNSDGWNQSGPADISQC